jgi:catechol 2,3-dioxygenase-like lactoylglutathione lyase family enzyme
MGWAVRVIGLAAAAGITLGQAPGLAPLPPAPAAHSAAVTGIFNWIHSTADLDRGYAFYHAVFGLEMTNPQFGAIPGAPPPNTIRKRSDAIADPVIGELTNTGAARFRNLFLRLPNVPFGLELSEFNDIESRALRPNFWDPGATTLILDVRDINAVLSAIRNAGAAIVTLSARPVEIGTTRERARSILVRDPDGYLIQVIQATPDALSRAGGGEAVVGAAIGVTVSDLDRERAFYGDILGFDIDGAVDFRSDKAVLDLIGLRKGRLRLSAAYIPGTRARVEFYEFKDVSGSPVRLRIQDPGAPQLQLRVHELDPLIQRVKEAGYVFVSVGAKPIQRAFGRFVFALDPNGVLVEFVEPSQAAVPSPR